MASGAPSPGSLSAAIEGADRSATVLDDRTDIEDRAIHRWMRGHEVHRGHLHHLVMGTQPLPPTWRGRALRFTSREDAEVFLRRLFHDDAAHRRLRAIAHELFPHEATATDADLLLRLAPALVAGALWAIEERAAPTSRFVGKTDPKALAPINTQRGTKVDFAYIARLEGDQWRRGYVPMRKDVVIGRSGMTVASGFDVGQWSLRQLGQFGFPQPLFDKLKPFVSHPFTRMPKADVAAAVAKLGPVPELTKEEADLCDHAVFDAILGDAIVDWNRGRAKGVPEFKDLPAGWQTVWLSRQYQEGRHTKVALGVSFRRAAEAGKWPEAVAFLRSYTEYKERATSEANLLAAELPPPVAPPPAAKPAPGAVPHPPHPPAINLRKP